MAEMFRGDNSNAAAAPFFNTHFHYPADVSNQLQLCGNLPVEFHSEPVNCLGDVHTSTSLLQNKHGQDAEAIPGQHCFQFSLNNETFNNETDRKAGILNQNPVSTGLKLSYDDDERNSSLTSASRSTPSVFSPLSTEIIRELDLQKEEFDHFIRSQEESMMKGMRNIKQRHTASLMKALEKGVLGKLHEKDLEVEMVSSKNKELAENLKRLTAEAQNWCYTAKYNESVVNVLKTNLEQAMQRSKREREGLGECDVDDAASCIDPNNYLSYTGSVKQNMLCRLCRSKEVSVVLMPCRHLCLCKECPGFISVCPVCQMMVTSSLEVYLS